MHQQASSPHPPSLGGLLSKSHRLTRLGVKAHDSCIVGSRLIDEIPKLLIIAIEVQSSSPPALRPSKYYLPDTMLVIYCYNIPSWNYVRVKKLYQSHFG